MERTKTKVKEAPPGWRRVKRVDLGDTVTLLWTLESTDDAYSDVCVCIYKGEPRKYYVANIDDPDRNPLDIGPFDSLDAAMQVANTCLLINETPWGKAYES